MFEADVKLLTMSCSRRKLESEIARALDDSPTITIWTETPPFTRTTACSTHYITRYPERDATTKPRLVAFQNRVHPEPAQLPATLFPITEKILAYLIEQLFDGRPYREKIVEYPHRRLWSKWLRCQRPTTDGYLDVIGAAPVRVA
jgi:hypothetical protein